MKRSSELLPADPLHQRIPKRGKDGARLNDLLMIFPGLKHQTIYQQKILMEIIESLLLPYKEDIMLAELNIKIGTLWISLEPKLGLGAEVAACIHHHFPESRLVAQHSVTEA